MAIVSSVERKTGLIQRVTRKTADEVSAAMVALMRPLKAHVTTITSDYGREFAGHATVATQLATNFTLHTLTLHGNVVLRKHQWFDSIIFPERPGF